MIRIACSQYQIEALPNWESYVAKIENLVAGAKKENASILLLPEYAGIEIVCKKYDTDHKLFHALKPLIPKYLDFYIQLAKRQQIYIQPGTMIEETSPGKFVNRAYIFSPNDSYGYQDKLQLTQYEKNTNLLQPGNQQKIFDTSFGKIGIAVCYDSEFPEIIRRLVRKGVSIILVPSYTASIAGYHRVFLSCRARAIENQCYVAISYTIKTIDLTDEVDETYGQAAILGPADIGFPDDGMIAQGIMNKPMLVIGDLSLEALDRVRKEGQVHNLNDSKRYMQIEKNEIETIQLI